MSVDKFRNIEYFFYKNHAVVYFLCGNFYTLDFYFL